MEQNSHHKTLSQHDVKRHEFKCTITTTKCIVQWWEKKNRTHKDFDIVSVCVMYSICTYMSRKIANILSTTIFFFDVNDDYLYCVKRWDNISNVKWTRLQTVVEVPGHLNQIFKLLRNFTHIHTVFNVLNRIKDK